MYMFLYRIYLVGMGYFQQLLCMYLCNINYFKILQFKFVIIFKMEQKRAQLETYVASNMTKFIQPMLVEVLRQNPKNPVQFCIKWLQKYQENRKREDNSDDEENDTVDDITIIKKRKMLLNSKKKSRMAISQQVFGEFNKKSQFAPKKIEKSEEARLLILSLIRNSILFQNIDSNDEQIIIDAMGEFQCKAGDNIISEGEAGDILFIVESGQYECFKSLQGKQTYIKTYKYGQSFGQLALMYNAPRAATIRAKTDGKMFTLDRITFSQIVKSASLKRRSNFQNILSKIEIFSELNNSEKQQFFDSLKEQKFKQGDYIVEQGGAGDKFYLVMEGKLVAEKYERCSLDPKIVFHYKEGDYFGELALLHNVDRQANVKALTPVRLLSIGRQTFSRILGSLKSILQRNQKKYNKYGTASELI